MVRTCPFCGSTDIDEDAARGDATCMECGTVLEESIVVSENQFQERAGGSGHALVGQFVSMDRQSHSLQGIPGLVSQESRELTFQKGRRLIEELASQLRINQFCIDTSYNFFKMCVIRNLTRGRVRTHVVAACMYMTCRLENTPHLLLDFSDVTQVNVYDLGRCLSFLSRSLRINLPSTDPCLYIMRFACLLEFGEQQKDVVTLATRLVERMKRDWISTGRRPTGLCGAALLIAARAYNFNRTICDVVRVVHISETVVRKRLEEFSQTPSGALTIDEFQSIDLDQSEDPPAYREARRKAREEQLKKEKQMAEKMAGEVTQLEAEVELALEKKRREKFKNTQYAKELTGVEEIEVVGKSAAEFVKDQIMESVYDAVDSNEQGQPSTSYSQYRPTLQSLGISSQVNYLIDERPPLPSADNENGDLNLEDIDDDEIDSYILSNAESEVKERFWMKANGEHLKEMERRKREREEADAKEGETKKKRKKHSSNMARPQAAENGTMPSTAAEAIEKVIQEKKLSNKVNYEILKEIDHAMPGSSELHLLKPIPTYEAASLIKREKNLARRNNKAANHDTLNLVKESLSIIAVKPESKELTVEKSDDIKVMDRRFSKQRPNLNISKKITQIEKVTNVKKEELVTSHDTPALKDESKNTDDMKIFQIEEVITLKKEEELNTQETLSNSQFQAEMAVDIKEITISKNTEVEITKEVSTNKLQRGKRVGPLLKAKVTKEDKTESEIGEQLLPGLDKTEKTKLLSRTSHSKPTIFKSKR